MVLPYIKWAFSLILDIIKETTIKTMK